MICGVMEDTTITDAQCQTHAYQWKGLQTTMVMRVLDIALHFVALTICGVTVEWMRMGVPCRIRACHIKDLLDGTVCHVQECAQHLVALMICRATEESTGTDAKWQAHAHQWKAPWEMMAIHAQEAVQ